MRSRPPIDLERHRVTTGPLATTSAALNNGCFLIPYQSIELVCIVSDGGGWDHVSVSVLNVGRCPNWAEMCYIKDLFWKPDETVLQYHPAKKDYVNNHPHTLHLWRPQNASVPKPPPEFV